MERGPPGSRAIAAWAAIGLLAASLQAQGRQPGGVHFDMPRAEIRLESEYRDETRTNSKGTVLDQTELRFREVLGFDLFGDVYHPKLLEFDGDLDLEWEQHDNSSATQQVSDTDRFNALYGLNLEFLQGQSVNGRVYAWRRRIETRQTLFATSIADVQEYGTDVRLPDLPVPSTLHYDHYTYDGSFGDTQREIWDRFRADGAHAGEWTDVDYSLAYSDVELLHLDRLYQEFLGRGSATQKLGRKKEDFVRVNGYYRDQWGDVDTEFARGSGTLHLQWIEELYSEHGVLVQNSRLASVSGNDQDVREVNSSIWHRLYRSLDSGLSGRIHELRAGERTTTRTEGTATLDYRKTTSFGSIGVHYRPEVFVQDESGSSGTVPVLDEPHVYTPGIPIFLTNFGVDITTVTVWDASRSVLYAELADYVLTEVSGRVLLEVTVGSRILPDSTILVDYVYEPQPDKRFSSVRHDVGVRAEFGTVASAEVRYVELDQELLSGEDRGTLENLRSKFARVSVHQWNQELGAEYEDRESNFTPLERFAVWARSGINLDSDKYLQGQVSYYRTRFTGEPNDERGIRADARFQWQLGRTTELFGRGEYHKVEQRVDRGWGWMVESGFSHRFRKTAFEATLRYVQEEFEVAQDQELFYAFLMVRRSF